MTIFNDLQANVTFSSVGTLASPGQPRRPGQSVYFEGTNIIVYIRGTEDEDIDWWSSKSFDSENIYRRGGVLVNAHYDSVSTGFGATDDGVGVISVLQLIRFFTTPGNEPKRGIVALLNNGEEDFLNGARAYTQHLISRFAYTFLNLEGAGAGGRATLFRSTDTEVTRAYAHSSNPFGTVVSADGFKAGFIRSQTDYVVFDGILGLRGLDVAFWYPRARYHTDQDDARHTSLDSLWHMLEASVSTVKALSSDTSSTFAGPRGDGAKGKLKNGSGTQGVWFDLFGKGFALFQIQTLFAWSLTILVASPLILILFTYLLVRQDKFYFFSARVSRNDGDDDAVPVPLYGWRGFSRFPLAFIFASGLTVGCAALVRKVNPLIVYSSHYAVWAMILSLWFTSFWWIMRGADHMRASALHRGYTLVWMYIIGWALLVAATVFEDRYQIATGYMFVFLEGSLFLATLISLFDMFALPKKQHYALSAEEERDTRESFEALPNPEAVTGMQGDSAVDEADEHDATETTPLVRSEASVRTRGRSEASNPQTVTTFAHYRRSIASAGVDGSYDGANDKHKPYGQEQRWSSSMPSWTWFFQFLLLAPFTLMVFGQVGLLVVDGISQTGVDGSSLTLPFTLITMFSIFLLLPLGPFAHRFTYHIPAFLLLVFVGTLIYNLTAFPFSANNRYKAYFIQAVDLESGQNEVGLFGLEQYIRLITAAIPSAAGQTISCLSREEVRSGLQYCSWTGLSPRVVRNVADGVPPERGYAEWLSYNVSRIPGQNAARFDISAQNSRACVLRFDQPIKHFHVLGAGRDDRFDPVPEMGSGEIRLWHRDWDRAWTVDVEWPVMEGQRPGEQGLQGKVVCLWSDANVEGAIPALDEIRRFAPDWSAVSKASDGLVEGFKRFVI